MVLVRPRVCPWARSRALPCRPPCQINPVSQPCTLPLGQSRAPLKAPTGTDRSTQYIPSRGAWTHTPTPLTNPCQDRSTSPLAWSYVLWYTYLPRGSCATALFREKGILNSHSPGWGCETCYPVMSSFAVPVKAVDYRVLSLGPHSLKRAVPGVAKTPSTNPGLAGQTPSTP